MRNTSLLRRCAVALVLVGLGTGVGAEPPSRDTPPLLDEAVVAAISQELSGTTAHRIVQELTLHHRQRGSEGFSRAVQALKQHAEAYGLEDVEVISLPADGEVFYGTQRSRPGWDVRSAELWEVSSGGQDARRLGRIGSYAHRPITLAQDSGSGRARARLVDVGPGTREEHYDGKAVAGNLVLVSSQPGAAVELAVERLGAVGIVSFAQNQRSAWWREDENLVRWGHMDAFPPRDSFAFMVSLKQARAWQERMAGGGEVWLEAQVEATLHPASYEILSARIRGTDPGEAGPEILFSCHLDHQRPAANDNASGCAAILEVARTLSRLITEGDVPRPRRSLRFVWPAEIEGTLALVNGRPDIAARTAAVIHMDMVGGNPEITKAVFHVTRSPRSLPTIVNDVAEAFAGFANEQSEGHAAGRTVPYPLTDPEGGKEAYLAQVTDFSLGSDHHVWTEGSFRVPAIYLNDWPDRYIHTHLDRPENVDPTKLLRAAFLGATSGYYLADLGEERFPRLLALQQRHALKRAGEALRRAELLDGSDRDNLLRFHLEYETRIAASLARFGAVPDELTASIARFSSRLADILGHGAGNGSQDAEPGPVYKRSPSPKGPMSGMGYSYLAEHLKQKGLPRPRLLSTATTWGSGSELAYEALNLVDGRRALQDIRDDLSAIYGPVPRDVVQEYLDVLVEIGVLMSPS